MTSSADPRSGRPTAGVIARLAHPVLAEEHAPEPLRQSSALELLRVGVEDRGTVRLREVLRLVVRQRRRDGPGRDRGDLLRIHESPPGGGADDEPVEEVQVVVLQHVLDGADHGAVGGAHLRAVLEREVGDRFVSHPPSVAPPIPSNLRAAWSSIDDMPEFDAAALDAGPRAVATETDRVDDPHVTPRTRGWTLRPSPDARGCRTPTRAWRWFELDEVGLR